MSELAGIHFLRLEANIRSALRVLSPDEMTPYAHQVIENILNENVHLAAQSIDRATVARAKGAKQ